MSEEIELSELEKSIQKIADESFASGYKKALEDMKKGLEQLQNKTK